jgi:hypothetical protein
MSPFLDIGRNTQLSFESYYCHLHLASIYINEVKFVSNFIIYWAAGRIFSRYDWALMEIPIIFINYSLLRSFGQKAKVKNWQCCLKRKPRAITFLSTAFGLRFRQDFRYQRSFSYLRFYLHLLGIFFLLIYALLVFCWSQKEITQHQA